MRANSLSNHLAKYCTGYIYSELKSKQRPETNLNCLSRAHNSRKHSIMPSLGMLTQMGGYLT